MVEDLNTLYYFTQVVEHHGFAAAGRALDMPKSKLSRRIAELEERLGVRLLHRTSRHCSLTEIGQAYYQRCLAMRVEAESAAELIERNRSEPQGMVRISCPTALLNTWVGPMLTRYMLKYPLVEVFIESTNRRVDLIHEGFDIALRVRFPPLENTDMVMKVLGNSTQSVVGSPAFLSRLSTPASPADLSGLPSLHWGAAQREYQWELFGADGSTAMIRHAPRMVTDDLLALRHAAVAGIGIVHLPSVVVRDEIAAGQLVELVPGWAPKSGVIHAIFPSRRGLLPSVRTLIDFLGEEFSRSDIA
ncbi:MULTISPECIES: LysR family transcriptional regulator [unclassified Pseudomonas]|jgi:DNA-binding transcriptional LysR family regulator|uniref:LysR family transcriptional regulator n=1 Tax=Pseudomonas TaxID=286 RepID=UPI000BB3A976|nr:MULTISPECIES: LysR family transcriptional regulator [unclassified Pseudomonas]MDF9898767.1 DNA-binding transcriptional LysR family regulator [Pseudomonas reinekei]PNB75024.1 LysR family transcriptional regulator [Pseudomonas sp. GW456-E7]MDF9902473.1 DNA-binding transcriptional LysR family regulator [Pseudomonas reinekei]PBI99427.1 HTH-type transcriptional regulator DmlR [Pseudomonas sp. ACN5]PMZ75260.1 LysR family transcriptional regulator [Pseudomonas sp. FW305-70]